MNRLFLLFVSSWLPGLLAAQTLPPPKPIFPKPLSPRIANYQIAVTLDPATKRLTGRQTLTWRNTSADQITELQFHLYLNAFRNEKSTFMRESGGQLRGDQIDRNGSENPYGFIDVTRMQVVNGARLAYEFIQPDDGNKDDRTVIRVPLDRPLPPGETIRLALDFQARLPKIFARTGYSRDFFLVGQWFPKIGVYEPVRNRASGTSRPGPTGQWNCHQFHAHSEFFADHGVYDVDITTPKAFWVSATGLMVGEQLHPNGTKTIRWHAEDVVDFAWTASPHFQVVEDSWQRRDGSSVAIELLLQPEHRAQADRHLTAAKAAMTYFDRHLGRYPYPNLTIVDPPVHASGAAGMEYPTFITAGTFWGMPAGVRAPEVVTVHEFGHQYFMQLLASNEFEEAWLDEGFTQYYEGRIMDETYGPKSSVIDLFGYRMGDLEMSRASYVHLDHPGIGPAYGNTWQLPEGYYGVLTYSKTATWLRTLEGLVSRPVMDEIMRTYLNRWQFKHPTADDFIAIVNEIVPKRLGNRYGPDMNWFFEQLLFGDRVCDYQLYSIRNQKQGATYRSVVRIDRKGDAQLPVDVLVRFDDGRELMLFWDGKARSRSFTLSQAASVVSATVDPRQKLFIDTNLNNNSLTLKPSAAPAVKYTAKFLFWLQNAMQWLAWLA